MNRRLILRIRPSHLNFLPVYSQYKEGPPTRSFFSLTTNMNVERYNKGLVKNYSCQFKALLFQLSRGDIFNDRLRC
jgi:hypothetical protein